MPFPRHTLAEADALVAAAGFASTSVDAAERCIDCRRYTRRAIVGGPFYCSAPMHVRRAIAVAEAGARIMRERAAALDAMPTDDEPVEYLPEATAEVTGSGAYVPDADEVAAVAARYGLTEAQVVEASGAPALDGEIRHDEHGARYWTAEEVAAERAAVTPEAVADAILDRRPILDLYGRPESLTREQAETVDAGVTLATERLAARYGTTTAEVVRLGREVVEETLAPAPRHYTREEVYARFREVDSFVLVLGPDDRAYDPETGDTLLGGVTIRYARGTFPGPSYTATIVDDEPAVDDDPREQPAPLEWSEVPAPRTTLRAAAARARARRS